MGKEGRVRATAASQYCAVPFHSAHSFHRKQDRPPVTCAPAQHHPAARKEPLFCSAVATDDGFVPEKPHLALESRSCLRLGTRGCSSHGQCPAGTSISSHLFPPTSPTCLSEAVGNARETTRQRQRSHPSSAYRWLQIVPATYTGRAAESRSELQPLVCPPLFRPLLTTSSHLPSMTTLPSSPDNTPKDGSVSWMSRCPRRNPGLALPPPRFVLWLTAPPPSRLLGAATVSRTRTNDACRRRD